MDRAFCEQDSEVVRIAPTDRLLREQSDQETWKARERGFCGFCSRGRAHRGEARVFRLEDEGVINPRLSIASGRGIATGVTVSGLDIDIELLLVALALGKGLLESQERIEAERGRLLEELNDYKIEVEQLEWVTLEMDYTMKAM